MLIQFTKGTVWACADRVVGETLDLPDSQARLLVEGYKVAAYLDAPPPPVQSMTVKHADPVIEHRDPVEAPKARRRRKG